MMNDLHIFFFLRCEGININFASPHFVNSCCSLLSHCFSSFSSSLTSSFGLLLFLLFNNFLPFQPFLLPFLSSFYFPFHSSSAISLSHVLYTHVLLPSFPPLFAPSSSLLLKFLPLPLPLNTSPSPSREVSRERPKTRHVVMNYIST